jgi:hypothetical protein
MGTVADIHQSQYQRGGESDTNKGLKGHHSGKNDVLICNKLLNISSHIISFFCPIFVIPGSKIYCSFCLGMTLNTQEKIRKANKSLIWKPDGRKPL